MDRLVGRYTVGAIALAMTLAIGAEGLWAFVCLWSQNVLGPWLVRPVNEGLEITRDGRALIRHMQRAGRTWRFTYRTIDGQEIKDLTVGSANAVKLLSVPNKPVWLNWGQRIDGFADMQSWPALWFLVRSEHAPGHAYFEIFEGQTRQLVGYFGPQGFRPDLPPPDEQFADVPLGGCSPLYNPRWGSRWRSTPAVYLVGNGELWLIDLANRAIRPVPVPGKPIAVAWTGEPAFSGADADKADDRAVVRTLDQIVLLDAKGELMRTLPIPTATRERDFDAFHTTTGDVILTSYQTRGDTDVFWLAGPEGAERHEQVRLAGIRSADDETVTAWYIAVIAPSPAIQAFAYSMDALHKVRSGEAASVAEVIAHSLAKDWPAIFTVCAVAAVLAAVCYRHHARYADHGAMAWALFVLVMGVPGAIGYWLHRRWPATERCVHCGAVVPRDRDNCLACATMFPAPAPTGIEVFA